METRTEILLDVFRPEYEMDDPALFAGRSQQVEAIARALHSPGSCPIIYGDRGLGKSSLALQAVRIALGDTELLKREGHDRWALQPSKAFVAFYVRCSDATQTKDEVLQRVLNAEVDAFGKEIPPGERSRPCRLAGADGPFAPRHDAAVHGRGRA